jgi:Spy/CpxP family protein refolding chaperone
MEHLSKRRNNMSKSKTITILASVIVISALMIAGCHDRMRTSVHHDAVKHITKTLALDASQQSKLKEVEQYMQGKGRELCSSKDVIEAAMKKQVQSDTFDAEALNILMGIEFDSVESTMSSIVAQVADFHSTLDSDQKEKLRELIGDWGGKRHERHHSNFCREVDA